MMTEYPYQDTVTLNLEGEIWKPVIGYEESYHVSNLGRVKSLDRVIAHPRLKKQFVKGRILKQKVILNENSVSDEPMVDLQVSLSLEGSQRYRNVRRLVYCAFVKNLSYEKDKLYVINVDCDGYNNRLENLKAIPIKEKTQRSFSRKRVPESHLSHADRSQWPEHGGLARRKKICQFDINGKLVASFPSIAEASRVTGVGEKEIIGVAKKRYKQWNGFVWKYDNSSSDSDKG